MKVLVISVRGLHLGYLGCYGNPWIETPALDELAADGIVFDQHLVTNPDPTAARSSWRSGFCHLPALDCQPESLVGAADLLTLLRQAGVSTHLVMDGSRDVPAGFDRGWDQATIVPPRPGESALEQTLSAAVHIMDGLFSRVNWLVWVDLATLVPPWDVPEECYAPYFEPDAGGEDDEDELDDEDGKPLQPLFDPQPGMVSTDDDETLDRLQYSYAGAVTLLDTGLAALIEELGNLGLGEEVVCMLTSDQGMPLGEHGLVGPYRPWLHDEWIHVPLLLSLPHGQEAGRRVSALTQACDLMPTLLDLFGVPIPGDLQGRNLMPLVRGKVNELRPFACSGAELAGGLEYALRTPDWALLLPVRVPEGDPPRSTQLYAKPEDRWEVNNLMQHNMELAEELEAKLREVAAHRQRS